MCQPSTYLQGHLLMKYSDLSQLGYDAYHSRSSSATVKNMYGYTFTFHLCLHGVYRSNFTLTYAFELYIATYFV